MSSAIPDGKGLIVNCSQCGQKNRLGYDRLGAAFRCPKCQKEIPNPQEPIDISEDETFFALISNSAIPILVDFWAEWCGPCKMVAPELKKVAAATSGRYLIAKVNTEELPVVSQNFQIASIPAMVLFSGGREVTRTAGARPAAQIIAFLENTQAAR